MSITTTPAVENITKLLQCLSERNGYGEDKYVSCWESLRDTTAEQFLELKYFYHQICYKSVTDKTDIARLKDRYEKRGNNTWLGDHY